MNRLTPISRRRFLGTSAAALAASGTSPFVLADAHGDTLRVRTPTDIVNLDPGFWQNTADLWSMDAVLPKLINFKPGDKWEWELYCAESIEAVDAKTINFKVRPGFEWSDGYGELTAEDVKFSFERYLDTDLNPPNGGNWALLSHVDMHDRYSGTIVFREPFSAVWWFVLPYATGSIVCKKAVEEAGGTYSLEPPAQGGPYKMVEHVPSQLIVLEAHDGWKGPQPEFKRIEFYPITDSKAAENAIQAGQLDVARVSLSIVPHLMENMPEGLVMKLKSSPDNVWLGMNMAHPKLEDLRVRQAILKAIDVEAILEGAYFGVAERAHGPAGKGLLGYIDEPPPPRDVEGARALLAEAGVDGLDLVLDTLADTDFVTAGQIVQANLAEIGINLEIATHEGGTYWSLPDTKGKEGLEIQFHRWLAPPDLNWTTQWLLPEQAGIWNWQWYDSKKFEELHFASMAETDNAKRHQLLVDMQKEMDSSGAYLWITQPPRPIVWRDHVVPAMKPNGDPRLELFKKA